MVTGSGDYVHPNVIKQHLYEIMDRREHMIRDDCTYSHVQETFTGSKFKIFSPEIINQ